MRGHSPECPGALDSSPTSSAASGGGLWEVAEKSGCCGCQVSAAQAALHDSRRRRADARRPTPPSAAQTPPSAELGNG